MSSTTSVYTRPSIRDEIARQRAELERRGITAYRYIGAAYTPKPISIPADQRWVSAVLRNMGEPC